MGTARLPALLGLIALAGCPGGTNLDGIRFACQHDTDCKSGFTCRGGECRAPGSGGPCNPGETMSCSVPSCSKTCQDDGGFGECAPTSGGSLLENANNCGACGRVCGSGSCVSGNCTCAADVDCPVGELCGAGGLCLPTSDPCSTKRCPMGQVCRNGGCAVVMCTECIAGEVCTTITGICRPIDSCLTPIACGEAQVCEGGPRPDGTACDDGQSCTANDRCTNGACSGSVSTTYQDNDGDGVGDSTITAMVCPAPTGYVADAGDCDDSDAGVFQLETVVLDSDQDRHGEGMPGGVCVGASVTDGGTTWFKDGSGKSPWLAADASVGPDCDDSNPGLFDQIGNLLVDDDQDGFTVGMTLTVCVGAATTVNGRTYYSDGVHQYLDAMGSLGADCDDMQGTVTGPATYYIDNDGDMHGGTMSMVSCGPPMGYTASSGDCDDGNANVYQTVASLVTDGDHDGFTTGMAASQCVGGTMTFNGRAYYGDSGGGFSWLDSNSSLGSDCDDADAAVTAPSTWYLDGDGDGTGGATTQTACSQPANYVATSGDCDDANSNIFQSVGGLTKDNDQDGYGSGGATTQCVGGTSSINGHTYYRDLNGSPTWLSGSLGTDCNDTDAAVFQLAGPVVTDNDRDGYPPSNTQSSSVCAGAQSTVGGRTYYDKGSGGGYWMNRSNCINRQGSNCTSPFDCYDFNASANPVQTSYFGTDRGDGSFDYNCSGTQTTVTTGTACTSVGGTQTFYSDGACSMSVGDFAVCNSTAAASGSTCGDPLAQNGTFFTGACVSAIPASSTVVTCR